MSRILTSGKPPRKYESGVWGQILSRITNAVNKLSNDLGGVEQELNRTRLALTDRETVKKLHLDTPIAVLEWEEFDDAGTIYLRGSLYFTQGWAKVANVQYRAANTTLGGNVDSITTWIDWDDGASAMTFEADSAYVAGGYYELLLEMPIIKKGDKNTVFTIDIRALDANAAVWFRSSHSFDPDKDPEIDTLRFEIGNWDETSGLWEVFAVGNADQDAKSIAFAVQADTDLDVDSVLIDGDFATALTNMATTDKRFNVSLGTFVPSQDLADKEVWVVGKAWTEINKGGTGQGAPYQRHKLIMPIDPFDSTLIDPGQLTANMLEDSIKRASVRINGRHKSGFEHSTIQYNGYIEYVDGTTYSMAGDGTTYQDLVPTTLNTLYYIFFDPSGWYGDGTGTAATALQITTNESIAKDVSGRRLLVGNVRTTSSPERAFFVFTGDQPVITAPFIYASVLSAITADFGTMTAGQATIANGTNTIWLNPSSSGVLAIGPTAGGYAAAPFHVAADGTTTISALVAVGYGQIQRQNAAPTTRSDATALVAGDVWIDTDEGDRVWTWTGSAWSESITQIKGGNINTGTVVAAAFLDVPSITQYGTVVERGTSQTGGTRPNGDSLQVGDTWWDTDGTTEVWTWTGAAYTQRTTIITGDKITTGAIQSATWGVGAGSKFDLDAETLYLGGSAAPKFSWNGSALTVSGGGTFTGALSAASGTFTGKIDSGGIEIGTSLTGGGDGIRLDANNFWRDTGVMQVGNGTAYLNYAAGVLTIVTAAGTVFDSTTSTFDNGILQDLTINGTLTMGASGVITNSSGELYIDNDEFVFGNSAANTVSTISLGIISTASTTTLQQASMNTSGFIVTDTSGGPAVTTSLTSQAITSNGNLSLLPSGTLVLDYATFPAADASGFLYSNGLGALSWTSAGLATGSFNDTEFQVDSGTTQHRQRAMTVVNGQITAAGTWGSWTNVEVF